MQWRLRHQTDQSSNGPLAPGWPACQPVHKPLRDGIHEYHTPRERCSIPRGGSFGKIPPKRVRRGTGYSNDDAFVLPSGLALRSCCSMLPSSAHTKFQKVGRYLGLFEVNTKEVESEDPEPPAAPATLTRSSRCCNRRGATVRILFFLPGTRCIQKVTPVAQQGS